MACMFVHVHHLASRRSTGPGTDPDPVFCPQPGVSTCRCAARKEPDPSGPGLWVPRTFPGRASNVQQGALCSWVTLLLYTASIGGMGTAVVLYCLGAGISQGLWWLQLFCTALALQKTVYIVARAGSVPSKHVAVFSPTRLRCAGCREFVRAPPSCGG